MRERYEALPGLHHHLCRLSSLQSRRLRRLGLRGSRNEDVDDMISDTRWVQLTELVRNMSEPQLAELDSWAGRLQKTAKAARKRVRQQQRSEE